MRDNEQLLLQESGLLVTTARIEIDGQTFAVRNVNSVKVDDDAGRPWGGVFSALCGVGALGAGGAGVIVGVLLLAGGAWLIWKSAATKRLVISTAGGETVALQSTDGRRIQRLHGAIAQAMAAR